MTDQRTQADLDYIRPVVGLHVGLLHEAERLAFDRLVILGIAYRSYTGASGFLGLAKVGLRDTSVAHTLAQKAPKTPPGTPGK